MFTDKEIAKNSVIVYIRLFITTIIGLITAIGRVFDAVTDPLVGNWSDNLKSKLGRRIPFMRWSAIPLTQSLVGSLTS